MNLFLGAVGVFVSELSPSHSVFSLNESAFQHFGLRDSYTVKLIVSKATMQYHQISILLSFLFFLSVAVSCNLPS